MSRRSLRHLARRRRACGLLLLLLPTGGVLAIDGLRRSERLLEFNGYHGATYLGGVVESAAVWGLLLLAASRRRGRLRRLYAVLFALSLTLAVGGQRYFHDQYNAYLNVDVSIFASSFMDSVVNQLFADIGNYAWATLPPLLFALLLLLLGPRLVRPRRRPARIASALAPLALLAALFIPTQHRHLQASPPDVLYLHAAGGLLRTQLGLTDESRKLRPRARESLPVTLHHEPDGPRPNIVLFILESVRADAVCIEHDPACRRTPYTNRAVPHRFPLTQMRALTSSTAISLAVLWSGVGPHESREVLHTWPLLFDYARAAGWDTAFWTSQNMMFGNARLWVKNLGVSHFVSATELDPAADLDMGAPEHRLAEHVAARVGALREPFLAVVQLSNAHYPYLLDPDGPQPFQPADPSKALDANAAFFNFYLNAVHQEDRHVAEMIRHFRAGARGERTVILYTSDHGEAFREHNQTGHTFSVFDEEIHVPAWVDVPPGILTAEQEESLRAHRDAFTFHTDIPATILDLMGVWNDPGIGRYREKMPGVSLLEGEPALRALPLTNCAGVWTCAFENWGYMRGSMKLHARSWDPGWRCYDVLRDPRERHDLGPEACGDLLALAEKTFGRLPGGE